MKKKLLVLLVFVCFLLSAAPAFATGAGSVVIDRVQCQSFPGNAGADLPFVGQEYSAFSCSTITPGITVTGWSLVDDSGTPCSGTVQNRNYTLSITVASQAMNYYFTSDTRASINGEQATLSPSADGLSATLSRYISPRLVAPTIWHNPADESHDSGETFSFTASASPLYDSFQWYLRSPAGQVFNAEDVSDSFPGVTATVTDLGKSNGCRCNFHNVNGNLNNWMVYCVFKSAAGEVSTDKALIKVQNADAIVMVGQPSPTPAVQETPSLENGGIWIVETPAPEPVPAPAASPAQSSSWDEELPEGIYIIDEDWDAAWTYDEDYHWHKSLIPENNDVSDKGTHDMSWSVTTPATKKADGVETGVCSECGYTATRSIAYVRTAAGAGAPDMLKWIIGVLSGIIILSAIIIIGQYIKDKRRRKRRARMSGRTKR